MNQQPHSILIIKPGAIGDLLQLTPVLRSLEKKLPDARVSILVGNRASTDLFKYHPLIKEIIVFNKRGEHRSLGALLHMWRRLRDNRYDLILNFQRRNLRAWLLASAAFPCRILVYHKAKGRTVHAVLNHLETIEPLGIEPSANELPLELFTGDDDKRYAENLFRSFGGDGSLVIALNPGASHPVNRWGVESFAELSDMLAEKLAAKILIVGGIEDEPLANEIVAKTRATPIVLTGKTTLLELGAVLQKCALLISGDTGPMHMSTAVGTRVLALFGAADPARTGPVGKGHRVIQARGVECVPCRSRKCGNRDYLVCMEKISVAEVFQAVKDMFAEKEKLS